LDPKLAASNGISGGAVIKQMNSRFSTACTRRSWLLAAGSCALLPKGRAADLERFYYRDYSNCLPDYLTSLARRAYDMRNAALNSLTTREFLSQRQKWV